MKTPNLDRAWLEQKKLANEAFEKKDALAMIEAETTADLISKKRVLAAAALKLAAQLQHLAQRLEAEPNNHHTMNTVGEVQSAGLEIDALCAKIGALREVLAGINSARVAAAKQ